MSDPVLPTSATPDPGTAPAAHATGNAPLWQPGHAALGAAYVTWRNPAPLPEPVLVAHSPQAAHELHLADDWLQGPDALQLFAGNAHPENAPPPWAAVYSGHQFGVWAGQLGDGRAITLGALPDRHGVLQEIQLKGSGRTPYSRMGDGRAVLRSSIRECMASEAMHALGVPTTRALCVVGSPEPVYREQAETAAVVTRFAPSFLRFGHFEHFAARGQIDDLRTLADHAMAQFFPHCLADTSDAAPTAPTNRYARLLAAVSQRTATLLAHWQALGFCHGVMNTDNMSLLGLTLDYGPYQFMDGYDPLHICNHSDTQGRYAFGRQPQVARWNLYALAHALQPLVNDGRTMLQAVLEDFHTQFAHAWQQQMACKLGLQPGAQAAALVTQLMPLLAAQAVDYTAFWRRLALGVAAGGDFAALRALLAQADAWTGWLGSYQQALDTHALPHAITAMLRHNPAVVPRNHLCQNAIAAAQQGDFSETRTLLHACTTPYSTHWDEHPYAAPAPAWAAQIAISCSS